MGGFSNPIGMGPIMKGAPPPEMRNWMHVDLQIEVEKWLLIDY